MLWLYLFLLYFTFVFFVHVREAADGFDPSRRYSYVGTSGDFLELHVGTPEGLGVPKHCGHHL